MKAFRLAVLAVLASSVMFLIACSSGSESQPASAESAPAATQAAQKEEPPAPSTFTARECFGRLQAMAARWSPDAKPFLLESAADPDTLGHDGKSPVWTGMFASGMRNSTRTFTCSKTGVSGAMETPFTSNVIPFDAFLFKTNSDEAYTVAQSKGGADLMKRDPKQPVTYVLQMTRGQSVPSWFVVYGTDLNTNKGIGVINATTGAFIRATK